jgi:mannose-6-phosphate isomerase-like protein (cupin superfamily)
MTAIVHRPGEGENIEVGGSTLSFKLTKDDGSPVAVAESTLEPRFPGPPLHLHREMHDVFFVLEGTMAIQVDVLNPDRFVTRGLAAEAKKTGGLPPPQRIAEIASDYDFEPVGPPSGD